MKELYKKLLEVQREIKGIKKDATNPFFKSKYFDINSLLAELKPVLHSKGLLLLQGLTNIGGRLGLSTEIIDTETEFRIAAECPITDLGDPQKQGSAITYFRRYALQSLLALEAEDDDGNSTKEQGISDVLFGKLRNAYKEKGLMTPEMQEVYEKCSLEQKKRIGDITKDLRKNKDAKTTN